MDKLAAELLELLRELLTTQRRLLAVATARQDAMRSFDTARLNALAERERADVAAVADLELRRRQLIARMQPLVGRGVQVNVTEVAKRVDEPLKTQLVTVAAALKGTVEELDRASRINTKVSQTLVNSLARVLKVVTGIAQHAGLYMRDGRKAAVAGVHLLDAVA